MLFDYEDMEEEFARSTDDPAAKPRSPLSPSPWLGSTRYNQNARIRLFFLGGVGTAAYLYPQWVSQEMHERFPAVEIAALELPGHGDHKGTPFHDYVACARAIAAELWRIHFNKADERLQPFAIYGYSLGSRIAVELAAILRGPHGEQCKKLYVGGRAAPHIDSPQSLRSLRYKSDPELTTSTATVNRDFSEVAAEIDSMTPEEVRDRMVSTLEPTISAEGLSKYTKMFDKFLRKQPEEMYLFAKSTLADNVMGGGPFIPISDESRGAFGQPVAPCPIHFYHAEEDTLWPLQPEGQYPHPQSWEHYTTSGFSWSTCPGVGHGEMGSVKSPAIQLICEDLVLLVAGIGGAEEQPE